MYNFVNITEAPQDREDRLKTTFNGVTLDDLDDVHIRTLNVTGRGLIAPALFTTPKVGAAGVWLNDAQLPARTIGIELLIKASDFRAAFMKLNRLLGTAIGELTFSDDPAYSYRAILQDATDVKEISDSMVITIAMLCITPYKYKQQQITTSAIASNILIPVKPVRIAHTASAAATQLKITNPRTGKHINIMKAIQVGDVTVITWTPNRTITVAGVPSMQHLNITSDYETFEIMAGDTLAATPAGTLVVTAQEIAL